MKNYFIEFYNKILFSACKLFQDKILASSHTTQDRKVLKTFS